MKTDLVEIAEKPTGLISGISEGTRLPVIITNEGDKAAERFIEFFTATIRNQNTRKAYYKAVCRFFEWCEAVGVSLVDIKPVMVAAYIEELTAAKSPPTVKQHLSAIRCLFDFLVNGQIIPFNPAATVRGPRYSVKKGKTPVLYSEDLAALFSVIDTDTLKGVRDRALLSVMVYSFARVDAVINMRLKDYLIQGRKAWFRLHEKGGKFHQVPAHNKAAEYVDQWISAAGISSERDLPLFRSFGGRGRGVSKNALDEPAVLRMIKGWAVQAGLSPDVCCHSMRASGITNYLSNGGNIEVAARIAAHESTRTTQLYNRTSDEVDIGEIERIRF